MPTVSVIVPVYNVESYLAETIQSVLSQTFPDFELLIIDDASPDRSVMIARSFEDDRIRIISQENRGLAGARNTGIRHAQGEYLAFLDGDDLWHPDKLAQHVAHLQACPQVGVSFSRSEFIDGQGKSLKLYQMPKLQHITPKDLFCRNPIGNGSAVVIRKAVFEAIAFPNPQADSPQFWYFDETLRQSEDIECWLRIVLQTQWQIAGIPAALTRYRVNDSGLSANILKQLESWETVVRKTAAYAPEFIAQWGSLARAYQLRYLARRAVRQRSRTLSIQLFHQALTTNSRILREEPRRTCLTGGAVYFLWLLPSSWYQSLETSMIRLTGWQQQRRVKQQAHQPMMNSAT